MSEKSFKKLELLQAVPFRNITELFMNCGEEFMS